MTGTWPSGWQVGDVEIAAQYGKGWGAIFDSTLGGSAANIDITGIVGTYAHLMVLVYARTDAGSADTLNVRFNADSGANYDYQYIEGIAGASSQAEQFAQTSALAVPVASATSSANLFSTCAMFIPHYAGTSNNKAFVSLGSAKKSTSSGNLLAIVNGGFWRSSAAITRITFLPQVGTNVVAGSRITVYAMGA